MGFESKRREPVSSRGKGLAKGGEVVQHLSVVHSGGMKENWNISITVLPPHHHSREDDSEGRLG